MKVVQLTPDYYPHPGGVEQHVEAISRELIRLGCEVEVVTLRTAPELAALEQRNNMRIRRLPALSLGQYYRFPTGLVSYLRRKRDEVDIFHVHNYHAPLIPLVAAFAARQMVVTTHFNDRPHSLAAQLLHIPYALAGHWSLMRARRIICVSAAERDRVVRQLHIPRASITIIPNGIDPNSIDRAQIGGPAPAQRDPDLLLVVSRLEAYKRVDLAIKALAVLPAAYKLVIVGDGPQRAGLQMLVQQLDLGERVLFTGRIADEERQKWYRRAAIFCNLSSGEAFGITLIEALAAGCRVVCSAIPAFRELAGRFPGWITPVPESGAQAIAAAVIATAQQPVTASIDLSDYTWPSIAARTFDLYRQIQTSNQQQPKAARKRRK